MTIEDTENEIVEKLSADIPNVLIQPFPDDPLNFQMISVDAAILVRYDGSVFSPTKAIGFVNQVSITSFCIEIITRHLRTHQGAYIYLDQVRNSLTGFQPQGYSKMRPAKEKCVGSKSGLWYYSQWFEAKGRVLEQAA